MSRPLVQEQDSVLPSGQYRKEGIVTHISEPATHRPKGQKGTIHRPSPGKLTNILAVVQPDFRIINAYPKISGIV